MVVLVACSIFAPLLAPHDPTEISMLDARLAPGEDLSFLLGTDIMGRDMLSRLIYGARTAMFISLVALGTGMLVGTILGLIAGFRTGWPDVIIMRASDAALGFPTILVAMIIVTLMGAGLANIILAVALTVWARFARMIRGDVLSIKELDFVTFRQDSRAVDADDNLASHIPQHHQHLDGHHQPADWAGNPAGSPR